MNLRDLLPQWLKNKIHRSQSFFANVKYGFPSTYLKIIGVTGTDGKTTTATMIYEILRKAGFKVGLITTVSAKIGKKEMDTGFHVTTPDPWDVPKYLRMMVEAGMKWVVLEVTSHGLDQNRISYIDFDRAVFTNITHEHLDYHKTWRNLALAKTKLIEMVEEGGQIIYKDDEQGGKFIRKRINRSPKVLIPIVCNDTMVQKPSVSPDGLKFKYSIRGKDYDIYIPILGKFNIANAQCAIRACEDLVKPEDIIAALKGFHEVKGRMKVVRKSKPCTIIVDFAHTPNALEKALTSVKALKKPGRTIVVFGTAGLRDKRKRPMMGKIAARLADIIVITAEDPRTENLMKINDQIYEGASHARGILLGRYGSRDEFKKIDYKAMQERIVERLANEEKPVFIFDEASVSSREDAIEFAVKIAKKEDVVITTGKAHEKSLCFGTTEYPWSDFDAVKKAVQLRYKK